MPTSEDLVPNDLPYGSRQSVKAGMELAGTPTSSTSVEPGLPPPPAPAPSPAHTRPQVAAGFDALATREPANPFGTQPAGAPPPDPLARLRESPNRIIQEIADLMPDYLQG
jgi:hypothetical protein